MNHLIDLNADLGEDDSAEAISRDIAIMKYISSCNIACAAHAGTPALIRTMLVAAAEHQVAAGAHPSYPDRANFGRKSMVISGDELRASLDQQVALIKSAANALDLPIRHLKPHGALYNDAQDDPILADILVALAKRENLALVGMGQSLLEQRARAENIPYISEAFVDRRYNDKGRLVARSEAGAVIASDAERIAQSLALALGEPIATHDGGKILIDCQSLCLHSDSQGALDSAALIYHELANAGFTIMAPLDVAP